MGGRPPRKAGDAGVAHPSAVWYNVRRAGLPERRCADNGAQRAPQCGESGCGRNVRHSSAAWTLCGSPLFWSDVARISRLNGSMFGKSGCVGTLTILGPGDIVTLGFEHQLAHGRFDPASHTVKQALFHKGHPPIAVFKGAPHLPR